MDARVRVADTRDVPTITAIYNQGIVDRLATLETEEKDPRERERWLLERSPRHPVLVAESTGGS
ncbi:MAG: hypothetical protein AB1445_00625 [Bacillota bacterium]